MSKRASVTQTTPRLDDETAAHVATCREALPASHPDASLAFGFDGFVDRVREVVDQRDGPQTYRALDELATFGERIHASAADGASYASEWCQLGTRCGGHVAHLSRAMVRLGCRPTLFGTFGTPLHRQFREEFSNCELHSFGQPTVTDVIEFDDGKLMFQDTGRQRTLNWETIRERVGLETIADAVDGTPLFGLGYWAFLPRMATIWDGIRTDLWPVLSDPPASILVDPADVRQVTTKRLRAGRDALAALDDTVPVTMSGNYAETMVLAGLDSREDSDSLTAAADRARKALGVTRYAAHSPVASTLATADGTVRAAVPRTDEPVLTTSAGDHFNAGLVLARLAGVTGGAELVVGNAVAGHFVRTGEPPSYDEVRSFVDEYDTAFD